MNAIKINLTLIITLISCSIFAQQNYDLSNPVNGSQLYVSPEYVKMLPGFLAEPTENEYVLAKINPYILTDSTILPNDIEPPISSSYNIPGVVEGNLNVTPTGAATYEVPIKLPSGTAGMAPQLSFVYNSFGENGLLGVGWNISGMSSISRVPSTHYFDAHVKEVTLDLQDRFTLDGQRLILISGTYGADGSEYRTEINNFSRIKAYGGNGTGPEKFKVWTKSGLIKEYGYTADSRIEAEGSVSVLNWQLNKITDTQGNYINFIYEEDNTNGEYRPIRIEYTGNQKTGLEPYCKVEFVYEYRSDQTAFYLAGSLSKVTKRLKEVVTYYETNRIKRYLLSYSYIGEGNRSHITAIKEYGPDNLTYYNPLTFEWQQEIVGLAKEIYDQSYYATNYATHNCQFFHGDFNGDGRMDFITIPIKDFPNDPATWTGFRLFLAKEDGQGFKYEISAAYTYDFDYKNVLVGDYNGDGLSDIVIQSTYSGNSASDSYTLYTSQKDVDGNISFYHIPHDFIKIVDKSKTHEMLTGDFNGDGINDLYFRDDESSYNDFLLGTSSGEFIEHRHFASGTGKVQVYGDYNGDGIDDFVLFNGTSCFLFNTELIPGELYTPRFESLSGSYSFGLPDNRIRRFGDFNGDGKTDIIVFGIEGGSPWSVWHIYFSNGISSERIMFNTKRSDVADHKIEIHDFNADGKSDILIIANEGTGWEGRELYLANSAGTNFIKADEGPIYPSVGQRFYFGDFSGDGATDFFIVDNDKGQALSYWKGYQLYHKGRQIKDLMTKITDGLGLQTQLVYKPLTDNSVYTKKNNATYPLSDIEAPLFVVDSVLRENGSGNFLSTTYHYTGAVIHKKGKGFLGFQKVESVDNETGIKTLQELNFDNPYYFPEQKLVEKLYNNTSIGKSSFKYNYKTVSGTKIFFPYVSESTEDSKKLDGTIYHNVISTFTYDDFGNLLTTEANHNNSLAIETSTNQYDNLITVDKWHLGRLKRSEVTKTYAPESPITRISAFDYDIETGLLNKEIIEPDSSNYRYEKLYIHDDYGNITETRFKRTNLEDRVTKSWYDNKGRFEVKNENEIGHVSTKIHENFYGNVVQAISANGLMTQFVYDDFGNLLKTIAPDGNVAVSKDLWVEPGDADAPAGALYFGWAQASGSPVTKEYYDKQGRPLRKITTGFGGNTIYIDTKYNEIGQVKEVSDPYFIGNTPLWTTYEYDALGRIKTQTLPGNRVTTTIYNGLETKVTGPLNKSITKTTDIFGNLVSSEDHYGNTVTYKYFSSGLLKEVIAPGNAYKILMDYDLLGNQTMLNDPNLGIVNYAYNVYGELLSQTDEGSTTYMEYDLLGRIIKRIAPEGITNWIYDQGFKGRLSSVSGPEGIAQSFQYDDYGRLCLESEIIQGQTYVTRHTYDDLGREDQLIYPSNFAVKHVYDSHGYLAKIKRASDGIILWEAKVADARGQLKQMQLGNGLITQKEYWENTGYIKNIKTGSVQNLDFIWDDRGNLLQRKKGLITEDFTYDDLDRLLTAKVNTLPVVTVTYDALGNIKSKTDVAAGSFSYGLNAGPNALTGIAGSNGVISDITQEIDYSSFHKVTSIREGTEHEVQFIYGPEHTRKVMKRFVSGVVAETKTYVGLYEKEETGGTVKEIHYLNGGDGLFAIHTIENETTATTAYVLKDHLGSIHCLVNQSGAVTEELSFDAWGRRRNPLNWEPLTQAGNHTTMLGFTGHEHIDIAALVNMNGRVYDPLTGRFLSPDPFMQAPGYSQGLNRYSYCLNNPLSLTDPSGYTWLSDNWRSLLAGAVGVSVAILTAGTGTAGSIALGQAILSGAAGGFAGGFTGSLLNGGNVGDAVKAGVIGGVIGGISAGAANKIGSFIDVGNFNFQKELARSLAHGSVGGLTSMAQGGKFKHGFFAGSFASMAGSGMQASGWGVFQTQVGGGIAAAVVGGTASELGGGKFANGAVTGAYTMLFNHLAHRHKDPLGGVNGERESYLSLAPVQNFSGFWGGIKYIWTGGNIDGFHYNWDGIATGLAPITGMAPTPGTGKGSKFAAQLTKQLEKDGAKSILKSYSAIQRRLFEHEAKLPGLQYKSSVEREIRTFNIQLETLKEFMKKNGIGY